MSEKSNEIPAARELLEILDLGGAVVTMDALHTQHDTATLVIGARADYVLTVKTNQKSLYAQLKALPWARVPAATRTGRGHGRRATRTIEVADVPARITFTGAAQVAQLRRTVTRKGRRTVEIVYLITSADARTAPPEVLATRVQSHWEIEDRLHWVRDVTFDEDRSQVRTGNAPRVMAGLRNTAITEVFQSGQWMGNGAGARSTQDSRAVEGGVRRLNSSAWEPRWFPILPHSTCLTLWSSG
ncbi:ISAs1 family transposase [Streptomyces sp. TG1A-8]|uniref:ISAs1 family transposase n=1 Tax=Streptomyces sp. TG1A-8 TaxID=3051385 RepID=UPI00265B9E19|nr:ISAs1 family transposase [Streptomyces sp. TG1A-8]MDO0925028.1 ISAs1 family transposase [Streptomyces sp. TG1A-8]